MNSIDTESNEASVLDRASSQPEMDVEASTSEDVCNGEALMDDCSDFLPGRSRYGRTIKPRSIMNSTVDFPQSWKLKTRKQLLSSISNSMNESIDEINETNNTDESNNSFATLEEVSSEKIGPNVECPWMVGQLAWARVGNFPFWPCMVTVDPTSRIYYKIRVTPRSIIIMVHVHYFGDKGRHSWVSANCMMQFTSLDDFLKLAESLTAEMKKKDPKYAAAFVIKPGVKSKWQRPVQEATEVQPLTLEEKIAIFATKVKVSRSKNTKSFNTDEKNTPKRKRSIDQDTIIKRVKQENIDDEKPEVSKLHKSELSKSKNSRIMNGKIDFKQNIDSLPSSPSSHKSSSESSKTLKNEEDEENIFQLYYEDNKNLLESEYPDMPKDDIKRYLRKTWDNMDTEYRKKLGLHMTKESSHLHSKESTPDEDEISFEIDTKDSKKTRNKIDKSLLSHSKESTPDEDEISIEIDTIVKDNKKTKSKGDREENSVSETKRIRLYNLFKGMKQEKVCQICEKNWQINKM